MLDISVVEGGSGPVVILSGEADLTTRTQLQNALDKEIAAGPRLLTVDLSQLRFADSATVAVLMVATRSMRDQGGQLELLHPQAPVARVLELLGVDQVVTVRHEEPSPDVILPLLSHRMLAVFTGPAQGRRTASPL